MTSAERNVSNMQNQIEGPFDVLRNHRAPGSGAQDRLSC